MRSLCHDMCRCVCECAYLHDKTKPPDHNDVKLGTVVFLDTVSQPAGFGFKRSRSWLGLGLDSGRRFASTESAHTFSSLLVISVPKSIENMRPQNRQPALLTYDTFDLRVKTYIFPHLSVPSTLRRGGSSILLLTPP